MRCAKFGLNWPAVLKKSKFLNVVNVYSPHVSSPLNEGHGFSAKLG